MNETHPNIPLATEEYYKALYQIIVESYWPSVSRDETLPVILLADSERNMYQVVKTDTTFQLIPWNDCPKWPDTPKEILKVKEKIYKQSLDESQAYMYAYADKPLDILIPNRIIEIASDEYPGLEPFTVEIQFEPHHMAEIR